MTSALKDEKRLCQLPIDLIVPGRYQPRQRFQRQALEDLAESVRTLGIIEPVVVRPVGEPPTSYELIAGERRWRAAQLAGLRDVPAVIWRASDRQAAEMALTENIQREDLDPIEEAEAFRRLIDEFDYTQERIARLYGAEPNDGEEKGSARGSGKKCTRDDVALRLRLLKLDPAVQELIRERSLSVGAGKALLMVQGAAQRELARRAVREKLSVRALEAACRSAQDYRQATGTESARDPDIAALEQGLSELLGTRVGIQVNRDGRGKVVIDYYDLDQLQGLLDQWGYRGR